MILVDANLLIYSQVSALPQHERARNWLESQLNGTTAVGLPWASLLAFLRIVTNPRILPRPEPVADAWRQVEEWLSCSPVWIPQPGARHAEVLGQLLEPSGLYANLIPDADLAALAIEHGLILCSSDGDFGRFTGLRWENPIAG